MSFLKTDSEFIELSTVLELAAFIKKKPATIYSDLVRRPESLPPVVRVPGSRKPLFVNMRQWIMGLVAIQNPTALPAEKKPTPQKNKNIGGEV
jgi:hypothetical protein